MLRGNAVLGVPMNEGPSHMMRVAILLLSILLSLKGSAKLTEETLCQVTWL